MSYSLAPQLPNYVPDPGPYQFPNPPCNDAAATPQKICGSVTTSGGGPGDLTEVNWVPGTFTSSGTPNAALPISSYSLLVRKAVLNAPSTNAAAISIGPDNTAGFDSIGVGMSGYVLEMPDGTAFDLSLWFGKSASASQVINFIYLPA